MHLKLMIMVLAICVQDNFAEVQDTSLELTPSTEWVPDNLIRKSNYGELPPAYVLKMPNLPQPKVGRGYGRPYRPRQFYKEPYFFTSTEDRKRKRKLKLKTENKEVVRKITPVEVILDVEVRNSKERDDVEKMLLSSMSTGR